MDVVDPATGLSRREKEDVQKSWGIARQDLKGAGLGFFQAFFRAHPEYQQHFKGFAKVPLDELADNKSFGIHANNVMQAICLVADSLDDPDTLVDALKKLGQSHAKRHIKVEQFRNLVVVLLAFLESALGPENFTEQVKQSWIKALDVVVTVINTGLEAGTSTESL